MSQPLKFGSFDWSSYPPMLPACQRENYDRQREYERILREAESKWMQRVWHCEARKVRCKPKSRAWNYWRSEKRIAGRRLRQAQAQSAAHKHQYFDECVKGCRLHCNDRSGFFGMVFSEAMIAALDALSPKNNRPDYEI